MAMTGSRKAHRVIAIVTKDKIAAFDKLPWRKFQKRPVVVSATQMDVPFRVETLEGWSQGMSGDWLIKGILGELYPCNDAVFRATYEAVGESELE